MLQLLVWGVSGQIGLARERENIRVIPVAGEVRQAVENVGGRPNRRVGEVAVLR